MTDFARLAFEPYLARYIGAIRQVRYKDLPQLQAAPHANLAYGAAGTAHALLCLTETSRLKEGRRLAARLLRAALRDRTDAATRTVGGRATPPTSFVFGRAGIHVVAAMVHAGRASDERRRAVTSFVRASRADDPAEIMDGAAGHLVGTCMLRRHIRDDQLRRFGDELAEKLLDRARRRLRRRWRPADATGFAHGWPGVLYALVAWRESNEQPLEPWLVDGLIRLARIWRSGAIGSVGLRGTWCNGAAGSALLWCKAFEATHEKAFLRAARDAAKAATQHLPERTHLCCGMGGVAYALLAVDRIEPGRGWRERAREVGARAITTPLVSRWPNGLLWGHPGLVCLALDLMADVPRGFPCIEG